MKRLALGAVLALAFSMTALADYVLFHRPVGDWTVLCWRKLLGDKPFCRLSAPRASLGYNFAPNVIEIREWAAGKFQVIVTVRDRVAPGLPLTIRIDGLGVHETPIRADGMAWWDGEEAAEIILEMQAGRKAIYRVQTAPDGMPRDMRVSLVPFKRAFEIYRGVLRAKGVLK